MSTQKYIALLGAVLLFGGCASVTPEQLAATQGQVNDLSSRLKKLETDQAALQTRIEEVGRGVRMPSGVTAVVTPRRGEAAAVPAQASNGGYEAGLAQYRAGDINGAIGTFEQYLNSGANGEEALLAQYWLGDAYYTQRNFDLASRYLGVYLKARPNGERAQAALSKLVESLRALGRNSDADVLASQGVSALQ
ncbi:MAG: tetratricopeptide repeat protein [Cardiobacteriaceae bacterium]|nr:tetratricopeptide repeat protein [Cardiobacteriaceae bacterium]